MRETLARLLDTTPPRLLAEAAYGSLKPPPTGRLRRVLLHLSHSMTLARLLDTTPQSRFSKLILRIRSRTSLSICGRPPRERDFHRQNAAKPLRCQRTIVSGLKIVMASRMRG